MQNDDFRICWMQKYILYMKNDDFPHKAVEITWKYCLQCEGMILSIMRTKEIQNLNDIFVFLRNKDAKMMFCDFSHNRAR